MPTLRDFQTSFGAAVRGASAWHLGAVRENGIPLERRMDVYRNNVYASLIDALASAYPVIERLVGRDFFRAMGREYLRAHMPQRGTLVGFGEAFPDFLGGFGPASSLPYLCDVARIERAWLGAYHSADSVSLSGDVLAKVPPEELGGLCFELHPSLQFVSSRFPAWSIWRANQEDAEPAHIELDAGGETACVWRGALEIEVRLVDENMRIFSEALCDGDPLGDAAERVFQRDANFDLGSGLHFLLNSGAFVKVNKVNPLGEKS